jgi:hypothetical protein
MAKQIFELSNVKRLELDVDERPSRPPIRMEGKR